MGEKSGAALARSLLGHGARNVRIIGPPPASSPLAFYEHFLGETASALGRLLPLDGKDERFCRLKAPRCGDGGRLSASAPPVVIHPGSGGRDKCWPLESFLEIAGRLAAQGQGGLLVTGEAEARLESRLEARILPEGWIWMRRPSLLALAAHLARCRFYLGNDSGVTHLAAACGAPVLALFKEENAVLWKPCGNVRLICAAAVEEINPDDVWNEILRRNSAHG